MSQYDLIYADLVNDIIENGTWDKDQEVRTKWSDGMPAYTKGVFGRQIIIEELPIPTTKKLAWKTAIKEMLIFWVNQSNKKESFHNENCYVWDEWFLEDGTLGRSYPYQFESRPKKEIVLVRKKDCSNYENTFHDFIVNDKILPNFECDDELIGQKFYATNNPYGSYTVIDVFKDDSYTNGKGAKIQFNQTGYIAFYPRSEIKRKSVRDPYFKRILNIACMGSVDNIKNINKNQIDLLYTKWLKMIHRCYDKRDLNYKNYGELGVKVHDDWLLFENYLRDVRNLPQWHLAKEDLNNWYLDKDYYEAKLYSKDTCVWLTKSDNDTYRKQSKPFIVTSPNGDEEIALSTVDVSRKFGLDAGSISRVLNNTRGMTQTKGFKFKYITPKDGFVYRYKLSRNQVVDLIDNIKNTPASRRLMTSFWNDADVDQKALQECAYETIWNVENGKLDLILGQRSLDVGLGCSFNHFQYFVLLCMIAHICELKPGRLIHQIGSAHIYERHIEPLQEQIKRSSFNVPELWINPNVKDFNDFTIDDFILDGYEYHPSIKMEVAI